MTNALFLCGRARMRSPTAAAIAATLPGVQADYAGLSPDADVSLEPEALDWADVIFVMEPRQAKRLQTLHPSHLRGKRVITLNIPDRYAAHDPDLIARLTPKLLAALTRTAPRPSGAPR